MFMNDMIKLWINDTSMEEKINYALEVNSIKVCKEFGLTAEETSKKLKLDLTEVKIIYIFNDIGIV